MSICQDVWSFMVNLPFLAIVCPDIWHRLLKTDLNCWFWNQSCLDWVCNCHSANLQFSMFLILELNELFQVHEKLGGISVQLPFQWAVSFFYWQMLSEAVLSQPFLYGILNVSRKLLDCLAVKSQLSTQQCSNAKLKQKSIAYTGSRVLSWTCNQPLPLSQNLWPCCHCLAILLPQFQKRTPTLHQVKDPIVYVEKD